MNIISGNTDIPDFDDIAVNDSPEVLDTLDTLESWEPEDLVDYPHPQSNNLAANPPPISDLFFNVGGKLLHIDNSTCTRLSINPDLLPKIIIDAKEYFFLDKDADYLEKALKVVKILDLGHDIDKVVSKCSSNFLSELCDYGIIDSKYRPTAKAIINCSKINSHRIIRLIFDGTNYDVGEDNISKSSYFKKYIENNDVINVNGPDKKLFKSALFFIRSNKLYTTSPELLSLLDNLQILYEFTSILPIVSTHVSPNLETIHQQINNSTIFFEPNPNHQFRDAKYHHPKNTFICTDSENIGTISADALPEFDKEVSFTLTNFDKLTGTNIDDIMLSIDISRSDSYVDGLENYIIEYVKLVKNDDIIIVTKPDMIFMHPILYSDNYESYHGLSSNTKANKLYKNTLIEINRITIPLYLFEGHDCTLPVAKLANTSVVKLIVKMAPMFKISSKEVSILDISLMVNFVNVASRLKYYEGTTKKIAILGKELVVNNTLHIYNKFHTLRLPIKVLPKESVYDIVQLPLDSFGYIKDFAVAVSDVEQICKISEILDAILEIEIVHLDKPTVKLYSKLDSMMLNHYVPLRKLGHKLPPGLCYYTFTADPKSNDMLGGLIGSNYIVTVKVRKSHSYVNFYIREYSKQYF